MRNLRLTIAYVGKNFVGWQVQKNGMSVQESLETAWAKITQEKVRITASGRTDSGVHALAQVCQVNSDTQMDFELLRRAINAHTPYEIEVLLIEEAPANFHAIRDAVEKTYRYKINWGHPRDVFQLDWAWYIPQALNVPAMADAAQYFIGEHDFESFAASNRSTKTTVRTITRLEVNNTDKPPFNNFEVEVTANGFLYNMVRNIVGTLIVVGMGHQKPEWIKTVIAGKDRQLGGMAAPAHGLYMVNVRY